jgi:hypothetical protein
MGEAPSTFVTKAAVEWLLVASMRLRTRAEEIEPFD